MLELLVFLVIGVIVAALVLYLDSELSLFSRKFKVGDFVSHKETNEDYLIIKETNEWYLVSEFGLVIPKKERKYWSFLRKATEHEMLMHTSVYDQNEKYYMSQLKQEAARQSATKRFRVIKGGKSDK